MRLPWRASLGAMGSEVCKWHKQPKDEVLCRLRRVAHATTLQKFNDAIKDLKGSDAWIKNPKLQSWILKTWMNHHKVSCAVIVVRGILHLYNYPEPNLKTH